MLLLHASQRLLALAPMVLAQGQRSDDPHLWYITRAAAVASYVLLALVVDLGILRSLAHELGVRASWVLDELHQFLSLLAAAFVVVHLVSLLLDPFLPFSVADLLVPFRVANRQLASGLGVLGLYAFVVVLLSSWLRRFIAYRVWRGLHYVGFLVFFLVTLHGLFGGSDASQPWMHALYIGAAASVVFLVVIRMLAQPRETPAPPAPSTRQRA